LERVSLVKISSPMSWAQGRGHWLWRNCLPTWVSHWLVTRKMLPVSGCRRFAGANPLARLGAASFSTDFLPVIIRGCLNKSRVWGKAGDQGADAPTPAIPPPNSHIHWADGALHPNHPDWAPGSPGGLGTARGAKVPPLWLQMRTRQSVRSQWGLAGNPVAACGSNCPFSAEGRGRRGLSLAFVARGGTDTDLNPIRRSNEWGHPLIEGGHPPSAPGTGGGKGVHRQNHQVEFIANTDPYLSPNPQTLPPPPQNTGD